MHKKVYAPLCQKKPIIQPNIQYSVYIHVTEVVTRTISTSCVQFITHDVKNTFATKLPKLIPRYFELFCWSEDIMWRDWAGRCLNSSLIYFWFSQIYQSFQSFNLVVQGEVPQITIWWLYTCTMRLVGKLILDSLLLGDVDNLSMSPDTLIFVTDWTTQTLK